MDLALTPEQAQLRDTVERFGREEYSFARWRAATASPGGFDAARWVRMAELGWLAINVPEEAGGVGGSAVDTMVVMEGVGRHLMLEPVVSTGVVGAFLLARSGPEGRALLPGLAEGRTRVVLAHAEPGGGFDATPVATRAEQGPDGTLLHGEKSHVPDAETADWIVVPARNGTADDVTLFLVARDAPGMRRTDFRAADHSRSSALSLDGVPATVLCDPADGAALLDEAMDRAAAARVAEAVGAMDALRDSTLDYIRTRRQFGVPIGSFQALQHRIADMAVACEEARSLACMATLMLDAPAAERRRAVSAAKARVGQAALAVGNGAVQLHGGIGTSDELPVSHYLRRLMAIDLAYGNAAFHLERFAG